MMASTFRPTFALRNRKPLPATQEAKATAKPQKTEPKKPAPVKIAKTKKATAPSLSHALKEFICRDPKLSIDELSAKLEAAGFKGRSRVTVATLRSDTLTTLQVAASLGLFSGDL
jgi:hypothetical protein